jgi:hypothetical protein
VDAVSSASFPAAQQLSFDASGFQLALLPEASQRRIGGSGLMRGGAGLGEAATKGPAEHRAFCRPVTRSRRFSLPPSRLAAGARLPLRPSHTTLIRCRCTAASLRGGRRSAPAAHSGLGVAHSSTMAAAGRDGWGIGRPGPASERFPSAVRLLRALVKRNGHCQTGAWNAPPGAARPQVGWGRANKQHNLEHPIGS